MMTTFNGRNAMPTLVYRATLTGDDIRVGEPLGMDSIGWPYRVEEITHGLGVALPAERTYVRVEPWPLLAPDASDADRAAYRAALRYAALGAGPIRPCAP
jgi:hypothetical protein